MKDPNDPVGSLTNIAYPLYGSVQFAYDVLNRRTNMVDSLGTTRYTYDAAGQLLTEDGPFPSDTVTNTYSNRRRVALSLQQPTGQWTNGFAWDLAGRLTNVVSSAGAFDYTYTPLYSDYSGRLIERLGLPNGNAITNLYDPVARLLETVLRRSAGVIQDAAYYGYNVGNQRTAYTNAAHSVHYLYSYDPIGQLAVATSSVASENRGYAYDAAWNLHYLTNNGALYPFAVDNKNQLTNAYSAAYGYDGNGNLTAGDGSHNAYVYDDENRLAQWFWYATDSSHLTNGALRTDFFYDGIGRLRERLEYYIQAPNQGTNPASQAEPPLGPLARVVQWTFNYGVVYLYDGMRVIQERDSNNVPLVSYTRGVDLSGSLEGAGGIGGLLARSSGYSSGSWTSHAYYHADGNGNITCLVATNEAVVATYRYDPFGNTISQSGTLADANVYRFSSKEIHTNSFMYYYGYRFYDPELHRWINRDPIEEMGGLNLYAFGQNDPENRYDKNGLITGGAIATLVRLAATAMMKNCAGSICSTRSGCETCCGAGFLAGNAALQGLLVGDLGESLVLIELPPAAAGDAVISVVIYLWNTYNLASAYRDCMKSCNSLPSGSAPPTKSPASSPPSKR